MRPKLNLRDYWKGFEGYTNLLYCKFLCASSCVRGVCLSVRPTMGQDMFVAAYSMYLQANTMTTPPLVPHGT